ncbi:iron response transcriptional regulator IrrA [Zavarzinia sp. CC-PAN008]|uniref:iron response transcriptional regulator IrrA n=1 Tax=Zavarzinia sp. CC-PAN008 TaxID=3243332 RepID=UPI003F74351C
MDQITPQERTFTPALARLRSVGLRPTRQRLALSRLLFEQGDRHLTAEMLHSDAQAQGLRVSLATIYNTLHQFTKVGLLREVVIDSGRTYFDTNISDHHHFFFEDSGQLQDIPGSSLTLGAMPAVPAGCAVARVDVIIRLASASHLS